MRTGLRGSLPLRSVVGFQHHSNTAVWFSGLCPPSQRRHTSRPLATAWSVGSSGTAGVSSILVSLYRLTSLPVSHATFFTCSDDFLSFFLVIVTCFAMSFALRSDAIARLILDASLLHCTRVAIPTFVNCADQSLCWMRDLVFTFLFACCRPRSFC